MSTTLTPPPGPPQPPVQPPGQPPIQPPVPPASVAPPQAEPRASSRVIAILTIAFGAVLVLGAVISAVFTTIAAASVQTSTRTLSAAGVDDLDVDLAAGDLRIEFADVDEAELEVRAAFGADRWTFDRTDDALTIASPRFFGPAWIFGGNGSAVLRLPESLAGLDADLDLAAGELTTSGEFGELDIQIGAGRLDTSGSARSVSIDVNAGRADLDLDSVGSADLIVNAGDLVGTFTGTEPREITIDVSAGSLTLGVPEGDYDVSSNTSAGDFDNRIGSTPGAPNTIDVQVSAGSVTLRSVR